MDGFSTTAASTCKRSFVFSRTGWFRFGGLVPSVALVLLAGWLSAAPAQAVTLEVGPTRTLTEPAEAAAAARDGDRVVFDPGVYRGCAVWAASHLTLEARHPPATMKQTIMNQPVITGPVCADRALFLFSGNDITVRGLTFEHARDTDHNGAGILMEGANLTVENSQFLGNENGILAGGPGSSVVWVRHSFFRGNGRCDGACAHALYVGEKIARLEVMGCTFLDTHVGHDIKSRALSTVVRDSVIEDGPTGTSSYLIDLPNGGDARIVNNTLQKGPHSENTETAISIGEAPDLNPTHELEVSGNRFTSDLPEPVWFVRNGTRAPAMLERNTLIGRVKPLEGPGTVD